VLTNGWSSLWAGVLAGCSMAGVQLARPDAPGRTEPERPIDASGVEVIVESGSAKPGPMQWAEGAVWYQIFPDRFRNGNAANDPRGSDTFLTRWTADWYGVDPLERAAWESKQPKDAKPLEPSEASVYRWIFDRRYGGDLQGVAQELDYIQSLGVTAIYLNPIFEAQSLHKYDATDHRHIDMHLGWPAEAGQPPERWVPSASETLDPKTWAWTPADRHFVDVFLPECKKRGIRVILDGVWNHGGRQHFAFADVVKNGKNSRYADWFYTRFTEKGELMAWQAWDGPSGWLPKFRQTENGDLIPEVKDYIFNVTRRWMDPNGDGDPSDGIDGWRLDVVPDIGEPFWKDWNALVKQINPGAITIAEIWQKKDTWPQGKHFDTQMNYPFAIPVLDWMTGKSGMSSGDLGTALRMAFEGLSEHGTLIAQNLYGSHDTDRYVSILHNPGREYDKNNSAMNASPGYLSERPPAATYDLSVMGVAIQAAYVGAPMVYNGDELGMWGADDPDCRKPMPWTDLGPNDSPADRADLGMRERYARWLKLRQDPELGPVLRFGSVKHVDSGSPDVFAFVREHDGVKVLFAANRGSAAFDAMAVIQAEGMGGFAGSPVVGPRDAQIWKISGAGK
jgi:cyclomaltodextrinase / maltogenic alpha-amylase / neopullulanase